MKKANLTLFWKVLYYTWWFNKSKEKIRILHPIWFLGFILTPFIIILMEWLPWLKGRTEDFILF